MITISSYEVVNQTGQRLCNGRSCNTQKTLRCVITSQGFPWIKLKQYALHIFHLDQLKIKIARRCKMFHNLPDTKVILKFLHTHLSTVTCSCVAEVISATHMGSVINCSFSSKTILDCFSALLPYFFTYKAAIFSVFETRVWLIFHEKRGSAYTRGFGFQNKYNC